MHRTHRNSFIRHIVVYLFVAGGLCGVCQTTRANEPTLDQRLARLCDEVEKLRESMHIPGLALAIVKDDQVILSRGFGLRDVANQTPVTDETIFAIGSTTKAFTAALCALMVDEEKMAWNDPVRKHLPNFALHDPEANENITIADLLCHNSGLTRTDLIWANGKATREELLEAVARAVPTAKFREKFQYQNIMYMAAGMAAANAAGLNGDWEALLTQRLLLPLGMAHSTVTVEDAQKNTHLSLGYSWDDDNKQFKHLPMRPLAAIAPAGSINSSVKEMAQWVRLQLNRGELDGKRIISEDRFSDMWKQHTSLAGAAEGAGISGGYGLGWMIQEWRGKRVIEHGGNIDGFAAQVSLLPDDKIGYVLLTNVSHTPLQQMSISLVFNALLGEWSDAPAPTLDPRTVEEYFGKYRLDVLDRDVTVLMKDGKLAVDVPGQMVFTLKSPDESGKWFFELTDTIAISFERDSSNRVITMTFYQGGMTMECLKEGVVLPVEISLDDAQKYLGTFFDEELKTNVTVLHRNGRLAVDVPGQMIYDLHLPNDEGKWVIRMNDKIALRFDADEHGAINQVTFFQDGRERSLPRVSTDPGAAPPTLDEIMALHGKACGTEQAAALGPARVIGTFSMPNQGIFDARFEALCADPTRFLQHIDFGKFGWMKVTVDGTTGWTDSAFQPGETLPPDAVAATRFQNPFLPVLKWNDHFEKVEIARVDKLDDRDVVVIEVTAAKDARCSVFVDREHGTVPKIEYMTVIPDVASIKTIQKLTDWRDIHGFKFPHHWQIENDLFGKTVVQITSIEPIASVPADAFARPKPQE